METTLRFDREDVLLAEDDTDEGWDDVGTDEDATGTDDGPGVEDTGGLEEDAGTDDDGRGDDTGGRDDWPPPPFVPLSPPIFPPGHCGPFWQDPPQSWMKSRLKPPFQEQGDVHELRTFTSLHLSHVSGVEGFEDDAGTGGTEDDATGGEDDPPLELLPPVERQQQPPVDGTSIAFVDDPVSHPVNRAHHDRGAAANSSGSTGHVPSWFIA